MHTPYNASDDMHVPIPSAITTGIKLLTPFRQPLLALLAVSLTGCATMATGDVGVREDSGKHFQRVLFDGERVFVRYTANVAPVYGSDDEPAVKTTRWAVADVSKYKWEPNSCTCNSMHFLHDPARPPEAPGAATEIPLAAEPMEPIQKSGTGSAQDSALLPPASPNTPFTARAKDDVVTLTRRDPANPDKLQTLTLVPPTYSDEPHASIKRGVIYPFAVALDIVTFPVQAVLFLCCFAH